MSETALPRRAATRAATTALRGYEPAPQASAPVAPAPGPTPEEELFSQVEPEPEVSAATDREPAVSDLEEPEPIPSVLARPAPSKTGPVRRKARRPAAAVAASLLAVVVIVAGLLALARDAVVSIVPAAAPVYAMLGFPAEAVGAGLNIVDVTSSREQTDDGEVLVVAGSVTNVDHDMRPVPLIRVALFDADDDELQAIMVPPDRDTLAPGQRFDFTARLGNPAATARRIKVTFAARDGNA